MLYAENLEVTDGMVKAVSALPNEAYTLTGLSGLVNSIRIQRHRQDSGCRCRDNCLRPS